MKDTWLSRGMATPRYAHRSLKHLCCLMSALPWGVYWWLPLIPVPARNMWGTHIKLWWSCVCVCVVVCVCVCVCGTGLSASPLTLVVTVTLDSVLYTCCQATRTSVTPEATRYQHDAWRREEWGVWAHTQVDKNWSTIYTQCNSEKSPPQSNPFLWEELWRMSYLTERWSRHMLYKINRLLPSMNKDIDVSMSPLIGLLRLIVILIRDPRSLVM